MSEKCCWFRGYICSQLKTTSVCLNEIQRVLKLAAENPECIIPKENVEKAHRMAGEMMVVLNVFQMQIEEKNGDPTGA